MFLDVLLPLWCSRTLRGSPALSPRHLFLFLVDVVNMKEEGLHVNKLFQKTSLAVWSSSLRSVEKHSFKIKNEKMSCIYALILWWPWFTKSNWKAFCEVSWTGPWSVFSSATYLDSCTVVETVALGASLPAATEKNAPQNGYCEWERGVNGTQINHTGTTKYCDEMILSE